MDHRLDAVRLGVVAPHRSYDCIGPFTEYDAQSYCGIGCFAFRIDAFVGVRASREQYWNVFKNGKCVETCLADETAARSFIVSQLKTKLN